MNVYNYTNFKGSNFSFLLLVCNKKMYELSLRTSGSKGTPPSVYAINVREIRNGEGECFVIGNVLSDGKGFFLVGRFNFTLVGGGTQINTLFLVFY